MTKPMVPKAPRGSSLVEKFWHHVRQGENGCWTWCASCDARQQPILSVRYAKGSKAISARRISYEIAFGNPPGIVKAACANSRCVNPTHLYIGGLQHVRKGRAVRDFWSRLDYSAAGGCWEWRGSRTDGSRERYGKYAVGGRETTAHRFAWESVHGPVPDGMFVCHRCDNPPCCNPAHLFIGTPLDNSRDMIAKGRARHPGRKRAA